MQYFEPMFYLCSDEMPFGIRIEATLKYGIDGKILESAVNTAIKRYPYFSVKLIAKDGEIVTVPNSLPIKVFKGVLPYPLATSEVNYHIVALSYSGNTVNFYITHVITDGAGFMPFFKTVLYYYLCEFLGTKLPRGDIRLAGEPLLTGETENPFPEDKMKNAACFYRLPDREYFRLSQGGFVTDGVCTAYNFRAKQSDVMRFSHENDASPCALFSSVAAKAIWQVHPNVTKDLVSAISFNMRPALSAQNSCRMVCSAIKVRYPKKLNDYAVRSICTCTRGAVMVQSQPENVLYYAKQKRKEMQKLLRIPDIKSKKELLSKAALADATDNTFSVSYVGRIDYGSLTEHIKSVRNYIDGSTYKTFMLEISSFGEWFYVTMLQGFSSDVYYKALLNQLKENKIEYIEDGTAQFDTPNIVLPTD